MGLAGGKTWEREDRAIMIYIKKYHFSTAEDIKRALDLPSLNCRTICARIKERGVSEQNRIKRLNWCQEHVNWIHEEWRRVLWWDESPFVLTYRARKKSLKTTQRKILSKLHGGHYQA
jgi:hypothetical protein